MTCRTKNKNLNNKSFSVLAHNHHLRQSGKLCIDATETLTLGHMIERTPLRAVFKNFLLLASPAIGFVKNTATMISHFNAEKDLKKIHI